MSNEPELDSMSLEERARRWQDAANVNRDYLRVFGDEAEGFNRLGKALSELGQISDARESYRRSLELDPSNTIARRGGGGQFHNSILRHLFFQMH